MSYSFISASAEFTALCQSQLELLSRGVGAVWSAVYLTEELVENKQGRLVPLAIYPRNLMQQGQELPPVSLTNNLQQLTTQVQLSSLPLLQGTIVEKQIINPEKKLDSEVKKQLVLPLIYDTRVMGVLVTQKDEDWQPQELEQIEKIAQTLALARFLDHRYQWYQKQLAKQESLRQIEQDRLDDLLHQIRNPLTALRTFSKLLIKRLLPEDRNQSVAKSILRESDRLQELLEQFETETQQKEEENKALTLSTTSVRLTTDLPQSSHFLLPGNISELEAVSILEVLKILLISLQEIAAEQEIELIAELPQNLPLVIANAKALREVLNNLIDNALKYTPTGGKVVIYIIEKQEQPEQSWLGIAISDSGYGIPFEEQPKIFERHYRGIQAQSDIPGSGLGLAIAKDLVEKMGGKIEIISPNQLGKNTSLPGTTMIVWLVVASEN
ncbi:GAF sensor signal transduction histidine kinase [Stanieria cyanosphaera PCC 7437]|uniref:histidine kinase n=1 Tax=Stanieria cyanosphaera (strain ATCC 29371 / PCC 7437) TaxID=111780 RepID=K9XNV7_STAC7|nr:GAF domain-containing sensor histidine kinase [Stanieria cyanosphaera]AFZ33726.1 GAF sensor signal transduction histidine kinase [Stanieria cyanosphaera PCC 7437]